jgi:hypothetical protein
MAAFSPEPTDSGFELANWLFVRLVVVVVLTGYAGIAISGIVSFASIWGAVARLVVGLVGCWIAVQLLFESVAVLVETTLEHETVEENA